jgi:hypothetical protein
MYTRKKMMKTVSITNALPINKESPTTMKIAYLAQRNLSPYPSIAPIHMRPKVRKNQPTEIVDAFPAALDLSQSVTSGMEKPRNPD